MDTITSGDGCDSIVTLTLDVVDQIETSFDVDLTVVVSTSVIV
jgi:hypothetical protein